MKTLKRWGTLPSLGRYCWSEEDGGLWSVFVDNDPAHPEREDCTRIGWIHDDYAKPALAKPEQYLVWPGWDSCVPAGNLIGRHPSFMGALGILIRWWKSGSPDGWEGVIGGLSAADYLRQGGENYSTVLRESVRLLRGGEIKCGVAFVSGI